MWMAIVFGWTDVYAFGKTADEAKDLAVKKKKELISDPDELENWTWSTVKEYYGARCYEVNVGTVIVEN